MTSATAPSRGRTATGDSALIAHRPSHAALLRDGSAVPLATGRSGAGRLDAIIVPTARPASALADVIDLAAASGTTVVALCSGQANTAQVAERVDRVVGARGLVVRIDDGYALPGLGFATSSGEFTAVNGMRTGDLSVKRNVGLSLARLQGWRKILFVDDDVTVSRQDVARLAFQLEGHRIAGMACREFPDNSVYCHARRLAKLPQDVFVTGAVLGVNCGGTVPFFPDVYNEDWFFFAEAAAHHRLTKVGEARQREYSPFADPLRASREEFGDLLAEGLYAVMENLTPPADPKRSAGYFSAILDVVTEKYWKAFIDVRRRDLGATYWRLEEFTRGDSCNGDVWSALKSLEIADARYTDENDPITARRCVEFLDAWQRDLDRWRTFCKGMPRVSSTREALDQLELSTWQAVT